VWGIRDGGDLTVGSGLGLDGAGNIYVLVQSYSPAVNGVSLAGNTVTGRVALAKYDKDGHGLWAKPIVTSGGGPNSCALSVDRTGNSYWTFDYGGTAAFIGTNVSVLGFGGALVKCDSNGDVSWVRALSGTTASSLVYVGAPGIDHLGNVYVSGSFERGGASFGTTNLTTSGSKGIFLAKYDGEGDLLWVKQSGPGWSSRLAVDPAGNCLTRVGFNQAATFGGVTLTNTLASNYLAVVKYDPDGNVLWARQACQSSRIATVAADGAGNFYFAGECDDNTALYIKYDAEGNTAWSKTGPAATVYGLRADAVGQCYLMGMATTNTSFDSFIVSGASPTFLAKLDTTTMPSLNIGLTNDAIIVSWPVLADGFYLESQIDLGSMDWTSNSAPFEIVGSLNQVTLPNTGQSRFFRLRRD
jgi:hypothetical protein